MLAARSLGIDRAVETNKLHHHLKATVAAHGHSVAMQRQIFPLSKKGTNATDDWTSGNRKMAC